MRLVRPLVWLVLAGAALVGFVALGSLNETPLRWGDLSGWLDEVSLDSALVEVARWLGIALAVYVIVVAALVLLSELAALAARVAGGSAPAPGGPGGRVADAASTVGGGLDSDGDHRVGDVGVGRRRPGGVAGGGADVGCAGGHAARRGAGVCTCRVARRCGTRGRDRVRPRTAPCGSERRRRRSRCRTGTRCGT